MPRTVNVEVQSGSSAASRSSGASWTPVVSMTVVLLLGFGAALVLMRQRDVSRA